jgi:hypothetical protein
MAGNYTSRQAAAVRDYLRGEFPGSTILSKPESAQARVCFRLVHEKTLAYQVAVYKCFFDDYQTPNAVVAKLEAWNLAGKMRSATTRSVFVHHNGIA